MTSICPMTILIIIVQLVNRYVFFVPLGFKATANRVHLYASLRADYYCCRLLAEGYWLLTASKSVVSHRTDKLRWGGDTVIGIT